MPNTDAIVLTGDYFCHSETCRKAFAVPYVLPAGKFPLASGKRIVDLCQILARKEPLFMFLWFSPGDGEARFVRHDPAYSHIG